MTLLHGDCVEVMKTLKENSVDAIVTDPPYGLQFMGKEWDKLWRDKSEVDQAYVERTAGELTSRARKLPDYSTMSKGVEMEATHLMWAREAFRVLKPGGHMLAFSGSRTVHRMTCAIEDAGFEIRDSLMWVFGTGFPKSHDVSKGIDKAAGVKREVVGIRQFADGSSAQRTAGSAGVPESGATGQAVITAPATPEAAQWEGWGTALKPAHEPIVLCRKPLSEPTVAKNVLKWGVGALNINGCKVHANAEGSSGISEDKDRARCPIHGLSGLWQTDAPLAISGRESQVAADMRKDLPSKENERGQQSELGKRDLVRQQDGLSIATGESATGIRPTTFAETNATGLSGASDGDGSTSESCSQTRGECASYQRHQDGQSTGESDANRLDGTRSRALQNRTEDDGVDGGKSKAAKGKSASAQCTCQKVAARWPANVIHDGSDEVVGAFPETSGGGKARNGMTPSGHVGVAKFGYSPERHQFSIGDSGSAARFFYSAKASKKDRAGSKHPTVKPIKLMAYLCRLITPPGGIVLDPFAGSGTTGAAATEEGFRFILIERENEYIADIKRRLNLPVMSETEIDLIG